MQRTRAATYGGGGSGSRRRRRPRQGERCLPRLARELDHSPVPPRCRIDAQRSAAATEQAPRSRPRRNTGGNAFTAAWTKRAGGCEAAARTRSSRGALNAWAGVLACSTPLLVGRAVASMAHMACRMDRRGLGRLASAGSAAQHTAREASPAEGVSGRRECCSPFRNTIKAAWG